MGANSPHLHRGGWVSHIQISDQYSYKIKIKHYVTKKRHLVYVAVATLGKKKPRIFLSVGANSPHLHRGAASPIYRFQTNIRSYKIKIKHYVRKKRHLVFGTVATLGKMLGFPETYMIQFF